MKFKIVRQVDILDSSGSVVNSYLYTPFGQIHTETENLSQPYQYIGGEFYYTENSTGLQLLGQRWYDAQTGRFISRDPLGEEGGLNLYVYVKNNGVNEVDPYGLFIGSSIIWYDIIKKWGKVEIGCIREIADAIIQIYIRNPFNLPGATINDKREHCIRSCRIAKECGANVSKFLGFVKEMVDEIQTHLHIKVDPASVEDFVANMEGIQCSYSSEGCECCCKKKRILRIET